MKKITAAITIAILFSSCSYVKSLKLMAGYKKTNPVVKPLKVNGKAVYFVQMVHIAKPGFYDNAKLLADSFVHNNYMVYAEGVGSRNNYEEIKFIDTLALKKFRKVTNFDLTVKYTESNAFKHFVTKNGLIFQPKPDYFATAANYKIVDIDYIHLMQKYEDRYGEIILDSCDLSTSLGQVHYPCNSLGKKKGKIFLNDIVLNARNEHIAETIINSDDKKILIMYGANHYKGLKKELRKLKK